jgi:hypothetical protein
MEGQRARAGDAMLRSVTRASAEVASHPKACAGTAAPTSRPSDRSANMIRQSGLLRQSIDTAVIRVAGPARETRRVTTIRVRSAPKLAGIGG